MEGGENRKKETDGPENERIWFKLSCAHFFTVKTAKKCLAHYPSGCKPSLTAWWKTHHLYHKLLFVETVPSGACIRFQLAIMQSANNSQHNQMHTGTMCVRSPPLRSPAIQLPPLHCERQFPVWLSWWGFRVENAASNWISALLLKVQLSMAKLGGSGVWILVSWCKQERGKLWPHMPAISTGLYRVFQ